MIHDPEQRIKAILLMLVDIDPQMSIQEAFGYVKAVEAQLAFNEAQRRREAARKASGSSSWAPF